MLSETIVNIKDYISHRFLLKIHQSDKLLKTMFV